MDKPLKFSCIMDECGPIIGMSVWEHWRRFHPTEFARIVTKQKIDQLNRRKVPQWLKEYRP